MAFCSKCGAQVADHAAFCAQCGTPQGKPAPASPNPVAGARPRMAENTAGLLCYLLGWITGIVFLLIDQRPFVRFHAAQSVVVFGGLHVIRLVVGMAFGVQILFGRWSWGNLGAGVLLFHFIGVVSLVLWILLMVKAYQGERFKIPLAWEIAEGMVGKS